jgi:hypothetical protein
MIDMNKLQMPKNSNKLIFGPTIITTKRDFLPYSEDKTGAVDRELALLEVKNREYRLEIPPKLTTSFRGNVTTKS